MVRGPGGGPKEDFGKLSGEQGCARARADPGAPRGTGGYGEGAICNTAESGEGRRGPRPGQGASDAVGELTLRGELFN